MAEYIDREKLIAEYDRVHIGVAGGARKLMVDAPTEDVVPVVRCKDCKHYERPDLEEDNYFCTAEHTNKLFSPNKTDYCSYGERKADNVL